MKPKTNLDSKVTKWQIRIISGFESDCLDDGHQREVENNIKKSKHARLIRSMVHLIVYFTMVFVNHLFSTALYDRAELEPDLSKPNHLIIAVSSDRGLCGGIHSSITKAIKASLNEEAAQARNNQVVIIGDKVRGQLAR